jgi:glycosyltransferase involved in cell wall biosynthesis
MEDVGIATPLISVIINCFNGEKYLDQALDSVLAQTYQHWEIVFWDNQSTDHSAIIVKCHADARIRYFYAPHHTVLGEARNLAISQAKGEWVAFLDCDDLWAPEKLALQVQLIRQHGSKLGLVYGRADHLVEIDGLSTAWGRKLTQISSDLRMELPKGCIFPQMMCANHVPLVAALVKRSALEAVGGISPSLKQAEDYELFVKVSHKFTVAAVDTEICQFRVHQNNWSHIQAEFSYTESIAIVESYLPDPAAKVGLAIWQANYAGYLLTKVRPRDALRQLLKSGQYGYFLERCFSKIWSRLSR